MDDPSSTRPDDDQSTRTDRNSPAEAQASTGRRSTHIKARRRPKAPADQTTGIDFPETTSHPVSPSPFVRKPASKLQPDLSGYQEVRGSHIGDRYVRVVRSASADFDRAGPGHLVATEEAYEPGGGVGGLYRQLKRVVIGPPLATAQAAHERLSNVKALAVLSSDALSSVAYASEEILRVLLVTAGVAAMTKILPIGAAIVTLLIIVGISYRQTIKAYPHGGGAYIVAKDNLG